MTDLPEAPASVTYSITTANGFNALFTVRDMTGVGLLEKMGSIEKKFVELGYKPQAPKTFGKEAKPKDYADYPCPVCGSKVVKKNTNTGKAVEECEKRQFNFATKQTTGCTYQKWV